MSGRRHRATPEVGAVDAMVVGGAPVTSRLPVVAVLALSLLAVACGGVSGDLREAVGLPSGPGRGSIVPSATRSEPSFGVDQIGASPRAAVPAALEISEIPDLPTTVRFEDPAFGVPLVHPGDIVPGGPPPDGIPAVDHPRFHRVDDVSFLGEKEPLFVLELGGQARAYPLQILVWHEIVNDTVAGVPVAVTYCPLCNSAFAYDRRYDGRVLDFGVSGALWKSSLVMYDRQTRSLWSHFTGQGLLGVLAGAQLPSFPVTLASWSEFKAAHPDGIVLSRDTGFDKDYGRNPYPGYDDVDNPPFLYDGLVDGRYAAKTRVVGITTADGPVAVTAERLQRDRVVDVPLASGHLVIWWQPGTGSALDAATVADGRDVGSTGVFVSAVDGRPLHLEAADGGFRDRESGSTWNVFGTALSGPLAGRSLAAVAHVDTFWFAWAAFQPTTTVIG